MIDYTDLLQRPVSKVDKRLSYGKESDQFGELWLPSDKNLNVQGVVMLLHGGCWQASLPGLELMSPLAQDLRDAGYVVWNIEYRRLGGGGGYPHTYDDITAALNAWPDIAKANHLDALPVVLMGHSAGGHLALWAAAHMRTDKGSAMPAVSAVITLAGINDLQSYREHGPAACGGASTIDGMTGAATRGMNTNVYADTSPAAMLPLGVKQWIVAGAYDGIVPPAFAVQYADAAKEKGDSVMQTTFPDAGHFDLIDPQSDAWKAIRARLPALMQAE